MLIEMHAHTTRYSSCSRIDPVRLVRRVVKKGLQGMVITEHNHLWSPEEIRRLKYDAQAPEDFVLMAAQEVDTDIGHVLVYGVDHTIEETMSVETLRMRYPEAALVWAHPLRNGRVPAGERLLNPSIDAVEIFSNNHSPKENYLGLTLWHTYRFTAISGSDTHASDTAGTLPTLFDHPVAKEQELASEIRNGRCHPFYKEIPKGGSTIMVQEITMGAKVEGEPRQRIILKRPRKESGWAALRLSSEILRRVHAGGFARGTFRVPTVLDMDDDDRIVIEEGQRGRTLFDLLQKAGLDTGRQYLDLAAGWLARLHTAGISVDMPEGTDAREHRHFESYMRAFTASKSPYLAKARLLIDAVKAFEKELLASRGHEFVLVHGDFHPKNIIIGHDRSQDAGTLFISVVDFGSAMLFHPVFDAASFISQFRNQLRGDPHVLGRYPADDFVRAYLAASGRADTPDFRTALRFFRIRENLSIASFLIHVGKGESPDMEEVMEHSFELLHEGPHGGI